MDHRELIDLTWRKLYNQQKNFKTNWTINGSQARRLLLADEAPNLIAARHHTSATTRCFWSLWFLMVWQLPSLTNYFWELPSLQIIFENYPRWQIIFEEFPRWQLVLYRFKRLTRLKLVLELFPTPSQR